MIDNPQFVQGLPRHPELAHIAAQVLSTVLSHQPFWATDLGLHQWDDQLPPTDQASRQSYRDALERARSALNHFDAESLDLEDWADWTTLRLNTELLWDDETAFKPWTRDPNLYNEIISASLLPLARRQFRTPAERARSAASRLQAIPQFLQAARAELDNPPHLFTEMAIVQFKQTLPFLAELPEAFKSAGSSEWTAVTQASKVAQDAYQSFIEFLSNDLLPRSQGDFRLGPERYRQRLYWQEGVDIPVSNLLQTGYAELARLHTELVETAAGLGSDQPHVILQKLGHEHPSADGLLAEVQETLQQLRDFCQEHELVTIPPSPHPFVVETPAYLRMITFASIDPPGPFEREATQAYYQVTLPDPGWDRDDIDAHLRGFNRYAAWIISAHEVYPGHYVQFLHLPRARSTVRKVFASGAFIEGWAHYTEALMTEGEAKDPGALRLRCMQIMEALERVGRLIAGIRLHTEDWTVETAQEFFERECLMEPVNARREALRGTMDPFYLIYTLGKLEILRLREKAEGAWGSEFSLKRFHDQVLGHGFPMLPVLDRLLFDSQS